MLKNILQKHKFDFLLFLLTFFIIIPVILPCLHGGLFRTYDDIFVNRIEEMAFDLKSFQFPVRFSSRLARGAGYMLYNFYGPLPYYLGALFMFIGFSSVAAAKLTFLTGFLIAFFSVFLTLRIIYNLKSAVFGTIFFMFFPYLGFDAYKRGDLGELWAIAILPLCILFTYLLLVKKKKIFFFLTVVSLDLLFLSHTLSSYIYLPLFLLLFILLSSFKKDNLFLLLKAYLFSLLTTCFFWGAILIEKSGVWVWYMHKNLHFYKYTFLDFKDLLFNKNNPQIMNILALVLPLVSIIFCLPVLKNKKITQRLYLFSAVIFLIGCFLSLKMSNFLWQQLSFLISIMQTPWRFLLLTPFFGSFIFAGLFYLPRQKKLVSILMPFLIIFYAYVNYKNFQPKEYEYVAKYKVEDSCGTTWGYEYFPITVKACFKKIPSKSELSVLFGEANIETAKKTSRKYLAEVKVKKETLFSFRRYYYPGWQVEIDGKKRAFSYNNPYGIIYFWLKQGNYNLVISYKESTFRKSLNYLSLFSFILLFIIIGNQKLTKRFLKELDNEIF